MQAIETTGDSRVADARRAMPLLDPTGAGPRGFAVASPRQSNRGDQEEQSVVSVVMNQMFAGEPHIDVVTITLQYPERFGGEAGRAVDMRA